MSVNVCSVYNIFLNNTLILFLFTWLNFILKEWLTICRSGSPRHDPTTGKGKLGEARALCWEPGGGTDTSNLEIKLDSMSNTIVCSIIQ